jgi:hypothetical protein
VRRAVAILFLFYLVPLSFLPTITITITTGIIPPLISYNTFDRNQQMAAYRVASFAQQSYSIPMRSPVQFPKVNLDFTFHTTFSSPKLDLGRGSFTQPRFDARPVVSFDQELSYFQQFQNSGFPPGHTANECRRYKK